MAVLGTSITPGNAQALRETELAAGAFRVQLQYLDVLGPKDIGTGFRVASKGRVARMCKSFEHDTCAILFVNHSAIIDANSLQVSTHEPQRANIFHHAPWHDTCAKTI